MIKFGTYLLPFVCSACLNSYAWMYLSFNHSLEVMKNTAYIKNVFSLMQLHIFSISQKGYCSLCYERVAFCLKRGVLLGLKISDFGWKRGVFVQFPRKGMFLKLGYERGIPFGREWRGRAYYVVIVLSLRSHDMLISKRHHIWMKLVNQQTIIRYHKSILCHEIALLILFLPVYPMIGQL